ncbi:hypothetical protein AB5I41_22000 [Sphingomonas sp. MMS24-JH45]
MSENALTQTFRIVGDEVDAGRMAEGFSYTARARRRPAPARGDPLVDTVSVRRIGERALQEEDSAKGRGCRPLHHDRVPGRDAHHPAAPREDGARDGDDGAPALEPVWAG